MSDEKKWDDTKDKWEKRRSHWDERWERKRAHWEQRAQRHQTRGVWTGIIILVAGVLLLLNRMNFPVPYWVFTWPMLLLVIGLVILLQSGFRNAAGFILVIIGGAFLARDSFNLPFGYSRFVWPGVVILIGLLLIVRPKRSCHRHYWHDWSKGYWDMEGNYYPPKNPGGAPDTGTATSAGTASGDVKDRLDCTSVFSGQNRTVISKNFSGGELIAVFGGVEADLTRADINGSAVIDISAIFGGVKLFVPSNWEVRTNVTHVFAGIDDKRRVDGKLTDPNKILIITGAVVFGGIEIRSI